MRHRLFTEMASYADPKVGLVRMSALDRTIVIVATAQAQHALFKQLPYVPKPVAMYKILAFMVRAPETQSLLFACKLTGHSDAHFEDGCVQAK